MQILNQKKINEKKNFFKFFKFFFEKNNISILDIKIKNEDFHARFSAKLRTYEYLIINRQGFIYDRDRAWHVKKSMNLQLLKKELKF